MALPLLETRRTILIADDEPLVREVAAVMVRDHGGEVLLASDGAEAVTVFNKARDRIAAIVLDFSMPVMNGYEAFLEITEVAPAVPTIFISGLQISAEVAKLRTDGRVHFVSKPFHEQTFIEALLRVINHR